MDFRPLLTRFALQAGRRTALAGALAATWFITGSASADLVEFLSGAKAEGTVKKIDKEARKIEFDLTIGGRTVARTYSYEQIHAVTMGGKRYVLNAAGAAPSTGRAASSGKVASSSDDSGAGAAAAGAAGQRRTKTEVDALIEQAGRAPPDWYESTPLNYPQSLDLSFPEPAPGGWNNQKNVGQFVWDVINPNENRWREGVRLMHHLLSVNKDDAKVSDRCMRSLGDMYFRFFQDYARAAFWWRQAKIGPGKPEAIYLAECYWRLGNKQMATELLNQRTIYIGMIKLWGDMGDTDKAVKLAEDYVRLGGTAHDAYLLAAEACRSAGRNNDAIRYYQKVLDAPLPQQQKERVERVQNRARASLEAIRLFELSDPQKVADGSYRAESLGYEGPIEVEVKVKDRRIESVEVTKHKEKQYYSALNDVPRQIIEKQGVKGIDATSKATITAEAVINAAAKALASGAK
jgi:uncharacterized protein with FMN-binding domain